MHINPAQYGHAFSEIKRTSSLHLTCKLILFVSCLSIDSICTAKVLSLVLKKSLILYQLIPVVGYADLKNHYLKLDADVANVILIGCGAMIDLEAFFEIDPDDFMVSPDGGFGASADADDLDQALQLRGPTFRRKIYVMDGSRPWNLDNIFGLQMVVCFDDGFIEKHLAAERDSYQKLVDVSDHESETDADSEGDSDSEADGCGPPHTPSARRTKRQRRNEIRSYEEVLENYYNQGTALFTATTAIMYAMLATIGETNIENLWLSIIGLSSLDRLHPEVYDKIQPLYKEEVHRLSPSNAGLEKSADLTTLAIDKDYHLFLLRHWTLYDSFFYSSLVNSKLNLWRDDGKKKLHKMFAKMGISLSVAQQKWLYMDITIKKHLPVIFNKYLPQYGLEGVVREGFVRTFGFMGQLSAMECVEALTALLETDDRALGDAHKKRGEDPLTEADEISSRIEMKEKLWVVNFWSSWDALNMTTHGKASRVVSSNLNPGVGSLRKLKGFDLLVHGLESAKSMQQIIFRTGMSVLERGLIKNLRIYRLCVLNDGAIPDLQLFNNPLILSKLGNWLLENINEAELLNFLSKKDDSLKSNVLKPLVVASLDQVSDTYLIIGLAPKYPRGLDNSTKVKLSKQASTDGKAGESALMTRLNTFSVAFQKVAATSGAKVRINSFDSSIIEIRKDDLSPFLEKLTLSGLI
ncbi:CDC45-like protein [Metschnikowia bicuspidata var. bicuspidata NRRL YB-4993]|uniref:CDC45-like protein n=1 Tax=Metschnikowia bicuspidata var. bicuspidata NRRL YB-4993 TaxID=869754 RepID=A0A1A0HGV5_9ASCO|nr:CDC45-like protein [Metschnikowia bicuspidata var. bicuspidata NRRL YB-4993]OBA23225.1 CDC45-like protein [Metschnikowia bicuspidata var. bicuspidata NRRL YB-4993]